MTLALNGLLHVKVPVTDVGRSARWYMRLFDLELMDEFCEQGIVHERFTGVAFGADGVSELHDAPKLDLS